MRPFTQHCLLMLFGMSMSGALASPPQKVRAHIGEGGKWRDGYYRSPDGKYLMHAYIGEGDTTDLQIYRASGSRPGKGSKGLLADTIRDSAGYLWVPGKPHSLVFGVSGMYGEAKLALWEGGSKLRLLRPVKSPADETFVLDAISADGRTVYYSHGNEEQNWDTYTRGQVLLPQQKSKVSINRT